jgi:GNAT superfamily N-acetyltransferase
MITFQRETFEQVLEDIQPLWKTHYDEIAMDKDVVKLNPFIEAYQQLDDAGGLAIITMRADSVLVGYSFFALQYSFHYRDLVMAVNDLFYIKPEFRGTMQGAILIKKSENILRDLGIQQIQMRTKTYANFGILLERCGYQEVEVAYRKNISVPN